MKTFSRSGIQPKNVRFEGFTLIEVMITIAILAIIAAVALPAYTDYVTRSKLVEAKTNLSDMRTRMEQYFLDNRSYPGQCVSYASGAAPAGKIYLPASQTHFTISCDLTPTTYTVTAQGVGAMSTFVFTVNEANVRQTTGVPSGWHTSTTCWISRKSGEC